MTEHETPAKIAQREDADIPWPARSTDAYERQVARAEYSRASEAVKVRFMENLRDEHCADVPEAVASKIFYLAWERGHSTGWATVEDEYQELAEIVRDAYYAGRESMR